LSNFLELDDSLGSFDSFSAALEDIAALK